MLVIANTCLRLHPFLVPASADLSVLQQRLLSFQVRMEAAVRAHQKMKVVMLNRVILKIPV